MNRISLLRRVLLSVTALAATAAIVLVASEPPPPTPRAAMWNAVDDAVNKGLPKTAIEKLAPILEAALKDKAYPEAIRALGKRIALEGSIEGNKPEERITRLKAEIAKAPPEMVPVMESLLGHWYWHYFQQNRWRFGQRTATTAAPSADFTTWDLPRIFAEIDKHYTASLANEKLLQAVPIASYDALLLKGTLPDAYRPTLYDFLAFEAVDFYSSGEQAGAKAEDAFEIEASGPALGTTDEFLKWQPTTTDANSAKLKAIKLLQKLMTFHKTDAEKSAFLNAELHRLQFVHANAVGEEKDSRYKAALRAFVDQHIGHELSSNARHQLARQLQAEKEFVEARQVALQGRNAFPKSVGATLCQGVIHEIEAKELRLVTERVWNDPQPVIRVHYRNITKVYFRAVKADWVERLTRDRWYPGTLSGNDHNWLIQQPSVLSWSADLPATDDFQEVSHDVPAPKTLPPGYYYIVASAKPDFVDAENVIHTSDIWVSNLALVLRSGWGRGKSEGFVLHAKTGEPIAGARVRPFYRDRNGLLTESAATTTNADGLFTLTTNGQQRNFFVLVSHNGHELASVNESNVSVAAKPDRDQQVQYVLFTDRSIYRPGQTINYKVVCFLANQTDNQYAVVPNREVTIRFDDVSRKEIARNRHTSNAYGSFSGSFTAPRDRAMGQMYLAVADDRNRVTGSVQVEEYKRPKFQVTLDAPNEAAKLNGEVKLSGKAMAYTGAAINGAKLRYRVTREVRWPAWFMSCFWWRLPPNRGESQEISHGNAVTEADGTFSITFNAKPDRSVPEKDEPTFHYTITAEVTDTTGETRVGTQQITVGYTALQANIQTDEFLVADKDSKFTVSTTTLDGAPQSAKGVLKVYRLKEPAQVLRADILDQPIVPRRGRVRGKPAPAPTPKPDPADINTWELGELVSTSPFTTAVDGKAEFMLKLPLGLFRATLETQDRFGKPVTAQHNLRTLNPDAKRLGLKIPHVFASPKWSVEPGGTFTLLWGTGYESGRAYVELEHRGNIVKSFWTKPGETQVTLQQVVDESHRGGFHVRVTYVRENRAYLDSQRVEVPWSNKDLSVKWERFTSKLEPAKKETWTATITGPNATKSVAEMVAALYDASLDAYKDHSWMTRFNVFYTDRNFIASSFENQARNLFYFRGNWNTPSTYVEQSYRRFPQDLTVEVWQQQLMFKSMRGGMPGGFGGGMPAPAPAAAMAEAKMDPASTGDAFGMGRNVAGGIGGGGNAPPPGPDLSKVAPRKNLNETAFFFPHLIANADGSVKLEFTMPEALTKWKFMGFTHDQQLRSGFLQDEVVTAKDLMVQPNPPRFLREGDILEFSVKVTNQSATKQSGRVTLKLLDAITNRPIDAAYGNTTGEQSFEIAAGLSQSFAWKLTVPDGATPIIYQAIGATDRISDGEEGMLPVLSKRILVTESIPLPIRGQGEKTFTFQKLIDSAKSGTLQHQSLSVQMTSQPAWYAVLALPYLMEFPHECSEQTFNRLYANALARHIAGSDPKIRRVFDTWRNLQPAALDSPLHKNQDVKSVMIEETPWLRDADKEREARRNVGLLFDENRLNDETASALRKLAEMQRDNGMWPWFPGGPDNEYLTLYIVTGLGRMRHLGVKLDEAMATKALARLDAWIHEKYDWILRHSANPEANHLSSTIALYLYGRSFFLKDKPIDPAHAVAIDYWQRQSRNHWLALANRQSQAHIALGLKRFGDRATPQAIMKSIKERSVSNEELGMFWRDTELSWWWYHAPIETQAVMIEAFDEIMNDSAAVEDCKVWMLKQKQTQNWKTTKSTADAVYALLLRGDNLLKSDALVEVKLGGTVVQPVNVEAGTGFYEQKFARGEIKPEQGTISLKKTDAGVSWGSVHWQYLEDVSKVTPHDGTPLKLEKKLFKRVYTKTGPVLEPVTAAVAVGDEIVVRIVLRTDRDMEYVHLKDHRGSGTEPVNVLSRYKYQDGLGYYETTKDTASHFFIDYLPKGVYVFEYVVRVQHKGQYPTGLASIQCMYAPEFNSHSESIKLDVK